MSCYLALSQARVKRRRQSDRPFLPLLLNQALLRRCSCPLRTAFILTDVALGGKPEDLGYERLLCRSLRAELRCKSIWTLQMRMLKRDSPEVLVHRLTRNVLAEDGQIVAVEESVCHSVIRLFVVLVRVGPDPVGPSVLR